MLAGIGCAFVIIGACLSAAGTAVVSTTQYDGPGAGNLGCDIKVADAGTTCVVPVKIEDDMDGPLRAPGPRGDGGLRAVSATSPRRRLRRRGMIRAKPPRETSARRARRLDGLVSSRARRSSTRSITSTRTTERTSCPCRGRSSTRSPNSGTGGRAELEETKSVWADFCSVRMLASPSFRRRRSEPERAPSRARFL